MSSSRSPETPYANPLLTTEFPLEALHAAEKLQVASGEKKPHLPRSGTIFQKPEDPLGATAATREAYASQDPRRDQISGRPYQEILNGKPTG